MKLFILGVFGPWQVIMLLLILSVVILIPVLLITSRAKHKVRANTLDEVLNRKETTSDDRLQKLERLNNLRASGALSEAEFENEKKKILG